MLLDRIMAEIPVDTVIPKPAAKGKFTLKGEGTAGEERAIYYSIPSREKGKQSGQKFITEKQLEEAYGQLLAAGELTRQWWNENIRHSETEGGCNFTTVGGLLVLLKEAERIKRGTYRRLLQSNKK